MIQKSQIQSQTILILNLYKRKYITKSAIIKQDKVSHITQLDPFQKKLSCHLSPEILYYWINPTVKRQEREKIIFKEEREYIICIFFNFYHFLWNSFTSII